MRLRDLAPHLRARVEAQLPKRTPVKRRGVPNRWEREFMDYLERGSSRPLVLFERVALFLPGGTRYTPDILAATADDDERFDCAFYEVKGFKREAAMIRLRECAAAFPWWPFFLVTREDGAWNISEVRPGRRP